MIRLLSLITLLAGFCLPVTLPAQDSDTSNVSGPGVLKLKKARNAFLGSNYKEALALYEQMNRESPAHPEVNYRLGEVLFTLKRYPEALAFLQRAYQTDKKHSKDLPYLLGQSLHRLGQLDEAEKVYDEMMSDGDQSTENILDAERLKRQVQTARTLLKSPVPVKIINAGERINSPFDEYGPSLSADGSTMTFTARKPDTKGGGIEINDNKFYEDIYIANWNSEGKAWEQAAPVQGRLNTDFHDAVLSIAPDGKQIFLYKNTRETRSGDIYVSRLTSSGKWTSPDPLPKQINSSYFESSASLSADGNWLYFVSERKGGSGLGDIYRVKRVSRNEWGEPENLGQIINTPEDEVSVYIHPDGKTLFFSSKGHSTMGGYDIFRSTLENGKWSIPVNVGYPINTLGDDLHFSLAADNLTGYYSNELEGGMGERDIYLIDFSDYAILEPDFKRKKGNGLSILKGSIYDSDAAQAMEVELIIQDETGKEVSRIQSSVDGEYFITLPGNKEYLLLLNIPGFESVSEKVKLPLEEMGTFTLVKHLIVDRKGKTIKVQD